MKMKLEFLLNPSEELASLYPDIKPMPDIESCLLDAFKGTCLFKFTLEHTKLKEDEVISLFSTILSKCLSNWSVVEKGLDSFKGFLEPKYLCLRADEPFTVANFGFYDGGIVTDEYYLWDKEVPSLTSLNYIITTAYNYALNSVDALNEIADLNPGEPIVINEHIHWLRLSREARNAIMAVAKIKFGKAS